MNIRIVSAALVALSLAACATPGHNNNNGYGNNGYNNARPYRDANNCYDCGVVQRIESYSGERRNTGAGVIAGAVIGGVLGNQVGNGDGKTAATVAGAVAGGLAGNAIENNMDHNWYEITVRMNDGRQVLVTQKKLDGVREGSRVIIRNDRVQLN